MGLSLATTSFTHASTSSGLRKGQRNLQSIFPPYSQQCRDDAGPPFQDDETNTRYHDGKPAFAVGDCPDPLAEACEQKPKKEAFLEGPIDCGGRGWFCRILEEPGWPTVALTTDLNFGYCNTTDGFNDEGFDQAGHCHGSDNDNTFYWWVRDHWFRGYNGRLRCCCGWNDDVTDGAIVNSCDYRRLVTQEESLEDCRDANEDGVTPYRDGCSEANAPTLGEPIPEDDAQCWEVQKFGEPEDGDEDENEDNDNSGSGDEDEDEDNDEDNEDNDISGSGSGSQDEDNEDDEDNDNSGSGSGSQDEDNEDNEDNDNSGSGSGSQDEDNEDNEDNDNSSSGSGSQDEDNEDNENTNEDEDNEDNEDNEEDECKNNKLFRFKGDNKKSCKWIGKKEGRVEKYCPKKSNGEKTSKSCPVACDACSDIESSDEDNIFDNDSVDESGDQNESNEDGSGSDEEDDCKNNNTFRFRGDVKKSCKWIGKIDERAEKYCTKKSDGERVSEACPVACDAC